MTINAMRMYLNECSKDKHLELKNLDDTQEINKLYVSDNNIISANYDIIKHFNPIPGEGGSICPTASYESPPFLNGQR